MTRVTDYETQQGAVVSAVAELICEGGLAAASLRAVARRSRVSASQLVENWGGRDRMLGLAASFFAKEWHEDLYGRARRAGLVALVPQGKEEIDDARVWLAFCELSRHLDEVAMRLDLVRRSERRLLDLLTCRALDQTELDTLAALVDGIRHARCTPGEPLTAEAARAVLARALPERAA